MTTPVLRTGSLAHFDSMSGMIPCKVLRVRANVPPSYGSSAPDCNGAPSSMQMVTFRVTANRGPWKRGEQCEAWGLRVVPRKAYRITRARGGRILFYTVECDKVAP